jgi:hypothetical protein
MVLAATVVELSLAIKPCADVARLDTAPVSATARVEPAPLSVIVKPLPVVVNKRELVSVGCDVAVTKVPVNTGLAAIAPVVV